MFWIKLVSSDYVQNTSMLLYCEYLLLYFGCGKLQKSLNINNWPSIKSNFTQWERKTMQSFLNCFIKSMRINWVQKTGKLFIISFNRFIFLQLLWIIFYQTLQYYLLPQNNAKQHIYSKISKHNVIKKQKKHMIKFIKR